MGSLFVCSHDRNLPESRQLFRLAGCKGNSQHLNGAQLFECFRSPDCATLHPATPQTKTCPWGPQLGAIFVPSLRERHTFANPIFCLSVDCRSAATPCIARLKTHNSHKPQTLHKRFLIACGSRGKLRPLRAGSRGFSKCPQLHSWFLENLHYANLLCLERVSELSTFPL